LAESFSFHHFTKGLHQFHGVVAPHASRIIGGDDERCSWEQTHRLPVADGPGGSLKGGGQDSDRLPSGFDSQLGRSFGASELSIGQWQKVALGRSMMRPMPLLLILDEPTASLDAPTEHALFERFTSAAQDVAAATGGITVLVSHRFSTVRMADLIVVLSNGKIAESGSHEALMRSDGLYAQLYSLQARSYR
jgi:ATP-binding cassette, subfamily B, bacterial